MAIVWTESFDQYTDASMQYQLGNGAVTFTALASRTGPQGMRLNNRDVTLNLPNQLSYGFGFAFRASTFTNTTLMLWQDSGSIQTQLLTTSAGQFSLRAGATTFGTTTQTIPTNVFHYIEGYVLVDSVTGSAILRLDGATVLSFSNINTKTTGAGVAANVNQLHIQGVGNGTNWDFDDYVVWDTTGPAPYNTFLGDVSVNTLMASGNGDFSQLAQQPTRALGNALNVRETPPDDNASYNWSANAGDRDSYVMQTLNQPGSASVLAVDCIVRAEKSDSTSRNVKNTLRKATVDDISPAASLGTPYSYFHYIRTADPSGNPWTVAGVNATQGGAQIG